MIGIIETPVSIKIIYKPNTSGAKRIKPYVDEIISVFNETAIKFKEIKIMIENS